jgi:hypothetical protein
VPTRKLRNLIINARIGKVKAGGRAGGHFLLIAIGLDRLALCARPAPHRRAGHDNGAKVKIPALGSLDPASVNGKLILTVLGAIADFKAAEKYKGRKPTGLNQADQVQALAAEGVSKVEIAHGLPQPFVKHDLVCSRIRSVPF